MTHTAKETLLLSLIIGLFIIMMGLFCSGWYMPNAQDDIVLYAIGATEIAILICIFLLWRLNRAERKKINQ